MFKLLMRNTRALNSQSLNICLNMQNLIGIQVLNSHNDVWI